jgi:hypothetical protein
MGSNRFNFETLLVDEKCCQPRVLKTNKFTELVLRKSKLSGVKYLPKTYSVFESSCGVERMLGPDEDLIALWHQHKQNNSAVEFVIRKCNTVERRLAVRRAVNKAIDPNNNTVHRNMPDSKMVNKCYKKLNQLRVRDDTETANVEHVYEHIEESIREECAAVQEAYVKQIVNNEIQLKLQAHKMTEVEESIKQLSRKESVRNYEDHCSSDFNELKLSHNNINVLKYLYTKLRNHGGAKVQAAAFNKSSGRFNESRVALLSRDYYNSCGNSTDDSKSSSEKSSRSNSSSALESLV